MFDNIWTLLSIYAFGYPILGNRHSSSLERNPPLLRNTMSFFVNSCAFFNSSIYNDDDVFFKSFLSYDLHTNENF